MVIYKFLRPILKPFFLILFLFTCANTQTHSWIDSALYRFSVAAAQYDRKSLNNLLLSISRKTLPESQTEKAFLLLGLIYWRLELISYCLESSPDVKRYGKSAIEKLDEAEKAGADIYITASHKSLASQILASLGIRSGTIYGPRAAAELKKAKQANPNGYYSLLVEAINANQAPSFAGGNLKKAVELLEKLASDFPDSVDVKIHLSDAYIKTGRPDEARKLILPITKTYPSNLLAKKTADKLKKE